MLTRRPDDSLKFGPLAHSLFSGPGHDLGRLTASALYLIHTLRWRRLFFQSFEREGERHRFALAHVYELDLCRIAVERGGHAIARARRRQTKGELTAIIRHVLAR